MDPIVVGTLMCLIIASCGHSHDVRVTAVMMLVVHVAIILAVMFGRAVFGI